MGGSETISFLFLSAFRSPIFGLLTYRFFPWLHLRLLFPMTSPSSPVSHDFTFVFCFPWCYPAFFLLAPSFFSFATELHMSFVLSFFLCIVEVFARVLSLWLIANTPAYILSALPSLSHFLLLLLTLFTLHCLIFFLLLAPSSIALSQTPLTDHPQCIHFLSNQHRVIRYHLPARTPFTAANTLRENQGKYIVQTSILQLPYSLQSSTETGVGCCGHHLGLIGVQ